MGLYRERAVNIRGWLIRWDFIGKGALNIRGWLIRWGFIGKGALNIRGWFIRWGFIGKGGPNWRKYGIYFLLQNNLSNVEKRWQPLWIKVYCQEILTWEGIWGNIIVQHSRKKARNSWMRCNARPMQTLF